MKINGLNAETQKTRSNAEMNFSLRPAADGAQRSARPTLQPSVSCHVSPVTRHPQKGVALIITLILLSVVTFMAITFLALSRRERSAVSTVTDTASTRLAADAALANAEAQIIANVLSTTNPFNFTLLVSTNYINPLGFQTAPPATYTSPTNVNYYDSSGNFLFGNNFLQNLENLYYSPRAPVFIPNPTNSSLPPDFRFYLDLNRNGQFDTNGFVLETNFLGQAGINFEVGDPEWIGVLQRPDAPHGPNNPFVARYAFIAVPVGNTLDLNAIYNQAMTRTLDVANDGYFRNQGVGSWEINLAAFLTDLDPNQWDTTSDLYNYQRWMQPNPGNKNTGRGFEDALSLLSYRYGYNYNSLTNAAALLNGALGFINGNIDGYSDWSLMTTPAGINVSGQIVSLPWAGADNINHFFTPEELFNSNEISPLFVNSLLAAGNTNSIYEHYTFYRLLSQLGTDSMPESGKMNLNYDNLVQTNSISGAISETNFYLWTPIAFFTNAADRLLRAYTTQWRNSNPTIFAATFYSVSTNNFSALITMTNPASYPAFGVGNIPVLVSNQFVYSSAVNRLLQLAANIYDATTNRYYSGAALPTLFQPVFSKVTNGPNTDVYITDFVELTGNSTGGMYYLTNTVPLDLGNPVDLGNLQPFNLVYGVPIIVGAKKGLPNFNQFAMQSAFAITRKLQITRTSTNAAASTYQVNQMFNCSVSNQFAVECWNSYINNYPRPTTIWVSQKIQMVLTNDETQQPWYPLNITNDISIPVNNWTGTGSSMNSASFLVTNYNAILLPTAVYQFGPRFFTTNLSPNFETNVNIYGLSLPQPHWWLIMTNNLQVVLIDTASGRAIDYVQLRGPMGVRDLTAEILNSTNSSMWLTNLVANSSPSGLPSGVNNQIISAETAPYIPAVWGSTPFQQITYNIDGLLNFYHIGAFYNRGQIFGSTNLQIQVGVTASALTVQRITWQANDPLVHYLNTDLTDTASNTNAQSGIANPLIDWAQNERYQPWGVVNQMARPAGVDQTACNLAFKDPLVCRSDDWDFPANKFPTVGWLGRVHRGTPWQTVYLKASDILTENNAFVSGTNTWVNWTGNLNLYDATNAAPVQDRLLFDLFTTALNDNATRGTLSVNQNHLAAWSALFSGVVVLSNNAPDSSIIRFVPQHQNPPPSFTNNIIGPAGPAWTNSPLGQLVNGINQTRAIFTNADSLVGTFEHVGDILSVPQLTEQSPFLRIITNGVVDGLQQTNGISDEMYEWLPQQTMSLLRCSGSPRYVIYCYGQALKPAPNGIYTGSGQYFGMVTNYQVVSEIATRAVVRFGSVRTNVVTYVTDGLSYINWFSLPYVTNNNAVIESFNILPPD
jgi:hypothetical protein